MRPERYERMYERFGIFKLSDVLPFVRRNWENATGKLLSIERDYLGFEVKMTSSRYYLFKTQGTTCVKCRVEGTFFALERHKKQKTDRAHFNLYGIAPNGLEVMMTKDHIIPKSKGGANTSLNYQVMCEECNAEKADKQDERVV